MKELVEIKLHMKRNDISMKDLSDLTGWSYFQVRSRLKDNANTSVKDLKHIRTALNI
jgi:hypothetical protein